MSPAGKVTVHVFKIINRWGHTRWKNIRTKMYGFLWNNQKKKLFKVLNFSRIYSQDLLSLTKEINTFNLISAISFAFSPMILKSSCVMTLDMGMRMVLGSSAPEFVILCAPNSILYGVIESDLFYTFFCLIINKLTCSKPLKESNKNKNQTENNVQHLGPIVSWWVCRRIYAYNYTE